MHVLSEKINYKTLPHPVSLDKKSDLLLEKSATKSLRSKTQECLLRLKDHIMRFPERYDLVSIEDSLSNQININLTKEERDKIQAYGCSIRRESALRIADHLLKYDSIASLGVCIKDEKLLLF